MRPGHGGTRAKKVAFFTYIVTNKPRGSLYCGQTDDINRRAWEHRNRVLKGYSHQYNCTALVWFETFESRENALARERQIKNWKRDWKIELIEEANPDWRDLADTLI